VPKAFLQNVEVKNVCLHGTQIVKMRPELFSANLADGELPKCVSTSRQTASFLDA